MKRVLLGWICLFSACLAQGGGEALYKRGAAVYKSDPAQAFEFFVQAAEEGNLSAMVGAGHCCETGAGTTVDYAKAIEWYEKAIAHNSLKACKGLARIYASCDDPEFHDGEKAVKYASVIVRKKPRDSEALFLLSTAYARNIEFGMAINAGGKAAKNTRDLSLAKEMRKRVAGYRDGMPIPEKATEEWIFRAVAANSLWAIVEAVKHYADYKGHMYDWEKMHQICKREVNAGKIEIYPIFADINYFAEGDMCNFKSAYNFYRLAFEHACYERGSVPDRARYYRDLCSSAEKCFQIAKESQSGRGILSLSNTKDGWGQYESYWRLPDVAKARFLFMLALRKGYSEEEVKVALESLETGVTTEATAEALNLLDQAETCNKFRLAYNYYFKSFCLDPKVKQGHAAYQIHLIHTGGHKRKYVDRYNFPEYWNPYVADLWWRKAAEGGHPSTLKENPSPMELREWTRIYATALRPSKEEYEKALKYACQILSNTPAECLDWDVIAMAYARNRKFDEAIQYQKKAIEVLNAEGKQRIKDFITQFERRLERYKQGRPYSSYYYRDDPYNLIH